MRTGPAGWPLLRDGDGQGHGAVGEGVPSSPQARGFILRPALSAAHHVAGCEVLQCVGAAPGPGSGGTDRSPSPCGYTTAWVVTSHQIPLAVQVTGSHPVH